MCGELIHANWQGGIHAKFGDMFGCGSAVVSMLEQSELRLSCRSRCRNNIGSIVTFGSGLWASFGNRKRFNEVEVERYNIFSDTVEQLGVGSGTENNFGPSRIYQVLDTFLWVCGIERENYSLSDPKTSCNE